MKIEKTSAPNQDVINISDYGISYDGESFYKAPNGDWDYETIIISPENPKEAEYLRILWEERDERWEEVLDLTRTRN